VRVVPTTDHKVLRGLPETIAMNISKELRLKAVERVFSII
jgi:hypothetical protein